MGHCNHVAHGDEKKAGSWLALFELQNQVITRGESQWWPLGLSSLRRGQCLHLPHPAAPHPGIPSILTWVLALVLVKVSVQIICTAVTPLVQMR